MKEKRNILKEALFMGAVNICYKPDITYEDEKLQNAELTEPCIIICNHMSAEDGVVVRYLFRNKNVCSLMAKDLLEKPFFKYLVVIVNVFLSTGKMHRRNGFMSVRSR